MPESIKGICDNCKKLRSLRPAWEQMLCRRCFELLPEKPATQKQLDYLRDLGINVGPRLTNDHVSLLVNVAWSNSPATERQVEYLQSIGVPIPTELSKLRAHELIDRAHQVIGYVSCFCDVFFDYHRSAEGKFVKGNREGLTVENCKRVMGIVMAEPALFDAIRMIEGAADGMSRKSMVVDDTFKTISARLFADRRFVPSPMPIRERILAFLSKLFRLVGRS